MHFSNDHACACAKEPGMDKNNMIVRKRMGPANLCFIRLITKTREIYSITAIFMPLIQEVGIALI